ncbi:MAG TPA: BatD family protein, partial [Thermoanaerobaculia bacterium]
MTLAKLVKLVPRFLGFPGVPRRKRPLSEEPEEPRGTRGTVFALLSILLTASALANDLIVEPRNVRMNETVTIIVSLEGDAARAESVTVPLRNLNIIGEPSVSSEYAWINGETIRRKVFRYTARPTAAGAGAVGPLKIGSETFGPIPVLIAADRVSGSNDAAVVLRELRATGREAFFVIAEIDRTTAFVGEQIVVTWVLYNAASVQQWQVVAMPRLEEFWSEEIDVRSIMPEGIAIGDHTLQRVPIRRVALYPLRSGRLRLGGMTVEASILRRIRGGPFSMFEGSMVDTHFTSAPIEIDAMPIPDGPRVDATGALSLECSEPSQRNGGPVVVQVALAGRGNIRASAPPRFDGPLEARLQVTGGRTVMGESVAMTRRW